LPTILGSIRGLVLAPSLEEVSFAGRRFSISPTPATDRLEAVPQAVVCGFEWAMAAPDLTDLNRRLRLVEEEQRGFAYEGAVMAYTILDTIRGDRTRELLSGAGEKHILLAYIGIGFAMARLPRPLWKKVLPDLPSRYHPTMSWLAVDGYGFDRAYFDTERWVDRQEIPQPYPWQGSPQYFLRAVDQGIGRALWFISGADPAKATTAVRRFAAARQADLWSGVGLAATFAGGCSCDGMAQLRKSAGDHGPDLALGSVFAVKGRTDAGFVPEHTVMANEQLTGLSIEDATALADRTEVGADGTGTDGTGPLPRYEIWRRRIRAEFAPT
jgi:enediyne biosynthesis protein E2